MAKKQKPYDIMIIGAGAAGLTAAITAAHTGARVLVLEHMEEPAKKILSTGNGRCNFTNSGQGSGCYKSSDPAFVVPDYTYDFQRTIDFFRDVLHIFSKERYGYYYPRNESAAAVRDALVRTAQDAGARILTGIGIRSIRKEDGIFTADTKQGVFIARSCILACGGKAFPKSGSDGSGYIYAKQLGHTVIDPVPALVPLLADLKKAAWLKAAAGVRTDAKVTLFIDGKEAASDTGRLQLTDYGLSGIPVFQISGPAARALHEGRSVTVEIDFLPEYTAADLTAAFEKAENASALLNGLLHPKLVQALFGKKEPDTHAFIQQLKQTMVPVIGTKSFAQAQTTAGGISLSEINLNSLESKSISGLYFAGEILDIDGICGGYNLQWAFASGMRAAESAAISR